MKKPPIISDWGFVILIWIINYPRLIYDIASPVGVCLPCGYCFPVYVVVVLIVFLFVGFPIFNINILFLLKVMQRY